MAALRQNTGHRQRCFRIVIKTMVIDVIHHIKQRIAGIRPRLPALRLTVKAFLYSSQFSLIIYS